MLGLGETLKLIHRGGVYTLTGRWGNVEGAKSVSLLGARNVLFGIGESGHFEPGFSATIQHYFSPEIRVLRHVNPSKAPKARAFISAIC